MAAKSSPETSPTTTAAGPRIQLVRIVYQGGRVVGSVGAAVYLAEYASPRVRKVIKPVLEVLAGVPTVWIGLLQYLEQNPARDLSSIRYITAGGSAVPVSPVPGATGKARS